MGGLLLGQRRWAVSPRPASLSPVCVACCQHDVQCCCAGCPAGQGVQGDANGTCLPCPLGQFSTGGTLNCSSCPSNQTTVNVGSTSEEACGE